MKRAAAFVLAFVGLFILAVPGWAQTYPSKNVTIIVPYPAGGPTDQVARVLAQALQDKLKQNFIVENVSGGGTTIATGRVAHAAPDGYTLLIHNLQISANVALYKNVNYDTEKDLVPVIFINNNPLVLVGRKTLEPNTLAELLDLMKKQALKAATPGVGATGHLATTLLAQEAKIKVDQIPYRGAAPALQDIAGGHVDLFFATPQSVVQQVKAGQIKAYGITAKDKSPELPTADSFNKLNTTLQEIIADPAIVKSWADTGVSLYPKDQRTVAAARALLKSEIARWGQVVRDNNIQGPM